MEIIVKGLEIIQGKITIAEASRQFDLTPSEIESRLEDSKRGMENALKARRCPRAVRTPAQGSAGGVWQSHAGAARSKELASLLGKDES